MATRIRSASSTSLRIHTILVLLPFRRQSRRTQSLVPCHNTAAEVLGDEVLNKDERKALAEAWKADYEFTTSSVPAEKEAEVRQLIESYKGTQPESQEIPPGEDPMPGR